MRYKIKVVLLIGRTGQSSDYPGDIDQGRPVYRTQIAMRLGPHSHGIAGEFDFFTCH
jgi:hypothetical protein